MDLDVVVVVVVVGEEGSIFLLGVWFWGTGVDVFW